MLSDVTSTVAREKALADSEELFRSAFSGAPIGIALSDFDGRLLRVNPALADLLGRSAAELLEMTVARHHPPRRPAPPTRPNLARSARARSASTGCSSATCTPTASAVPVEVYAASVRTAEGEPYCIVAHVLPAAGPTRPSD